MCTDLNLKFNLSTRATKRNITCEMQDQPSYLTLLPIASTSYSANLHPSKTNQRNIDQNIDFLPSPHDCHFQISWALSQSNRRLYYSCAYVSSNITTKATSIRRYQCYLTYTKTKGIRAYNNHYHDRQRLYQSKLAQYLGLN